MTAGNPAGMCWRWCGGYRSSSRAGRRPWEGLARRAQASGAAGAAGRFPTASPGEAELCERGRSRTGTPFSFCLIGDTQSYHEGLQPLLDAMAKEQTDFVLHVGDITDYLTGNDQFFLNVAMVAAKATMDSAVGIPGCTLVTAMSRNGTEFGVRIGATGERWFTVGVSPNIVDASFQALTDSITYKLLRSGAVA